MDDLNQIMEILRDGRNQLAEQGIDQWQGDCERRTYQKKILKRILHTLYNHKMMKLLVHYQLLKHQIHSYDELNGDWLIDTDRYVYLFTVWQFTLIMLEKGYASSIIH